MQSSTERDLKTKIIEKAWADSTFKKQLIADPQAAIKEAFGLQIPAGIDIKVVEETASSFYLVIPQNPAEASSDSDSSVNAPMWPS